MSTKKDLLLLLLDVGEHMRPYLPLLHRLIFDVLTCKLISKPNHEVAVVLYGTKGTRHALYDAADPDGSYPYVTVLRPLQNVASHLELRRFAFAADPLPLEQQQQVEEAEEPHDPVADAEEHDASTAATAAAAAEEEAEELLARLEAAGLTCGDAACMVRALRLFGPAGPRADWGDGLVVGLDVLASALKERFQRGQPEAGKQGAVRAVLVSNMLAESVPYDDEFRAEMAAVCIDRNIQLDVFCLDHYLPPTAQPPPQRGGKSGNNNTNNGSSFNNGGSKGGSSSKGAVYDTLSLLPPELAAVRQRNLEQLHTLRAELAPATFRHLREPAELLSLFRAKEVMLQASNAVFRLNPGSAAGGEEEEVSQAAPGITLGVKLYKKVRRARVEEWRSVLEQPPPPPSAASAAAAGGAVHSNEAATGGDDGAGGGGGPSTSAGADPAFLRDPGFLRDVEYEDPTTGEKFSRKELVAKGYLYGKQAVPIQRYHSEYGGGVDEQMLKFREKDFSLLGFVDERNVPHHRLIDEPYVVLGDSPSSAVAIAALALALNDAKQAGIVRFLLRRDAPQLGALTPHLSDSADVPHALLLSPLPFAEDIRPHAFATFRNEAEAAEVRRLLAEARGEPLPPTPPPASTSSSSANGQQQQPPLRYEKLQPSEEQQAAALALVRSLDLGPGSLSSTLPSHGGGGGGGGSGAGGGGEPRPEALVPELTANPHLHRCYELVASRALDPEAQLPHPDDDPLVGLVLRPHGRFWPPGATAALGRAEQLLQSRERVKGEGPAAKRARFGEPSGAGAAGAAAEGQEGAAAGPSTDTDRHQQQQQLVSGRAVGAAAGGGGSGAVRVSRVGELSAEADFAAMLAQDAESASDAARQMQELIRMLVDKSIGSQLYDKALKCVHALRRGCLDMGRAGAFNSFLRDLVTWCKQRGRGTFVSMLATQPVGLITTADMTQAAAASTRTRAAATAAGPLTAVPFQDDGGAVEPGAAESFLEQQTRPAAVEEEATLPAVVMDDEFEDMD
ncbi:hypothetical protein Agub_g2217 [Astrephomene gubernaculifera]|uniref:Ku domain-containing protein n=1 Tax=Astrephomene gubernaculifera TaxID=47775 RepID=A0AAD3DKG5_9CHLO|nr:hypothetical protein Agub_g2217 [Astrephomene gubernaculifera]